MTVAADELARELRSFRDAFQLTQRQMAATLGASYGAYVTWEEGQTPREHSRAQIGRILTRWHRTKPRRRPSQPASELPFSTPNCCSQPMQLIRHWFSRARARQMWLWKFECNHCRIFFSCDERGNEVKPIPSGNYTPLDFPRPKCCGREMGLKTKPRPWPERNNAMVYPFFCRQEDCPKGRKVRRYEYDDKAQLLTEVTQQLEGHRGRTLRQVRIEGIPPKCKECGRPQTPVGEQSINGRKRVRFRCPVRSHKGSREHELIRGTWRPVLPFKRGPRRGGRRSTLPAWLDWNVREKCCGAPMRLAHEFPSRTVGGYRYQLKCKTCRRPSYFDARGRKLQARKAGRPVGWVQRNKIFQSRADMVTRIRNKFIFESKRRRWRTRAICGYLDSRTPPIPIPREWRAQGWQTWNEVLNHDPRKVMRLFSVTVAQLNKRYSDHQRQFYFDGGEGNPRNRQRAETQVTTVATQ